MCDEKTTNHVNVCVEFITAVQPLVLEAILVKYPIHTFVSIFRHSHLKGDIYWIPLLDGVMNKVRNKETNE